MIAAVVGLVVFAVGFPFAFANHKIDIDECWLGEQAYAFAAHGEVRSNLFRDLAPLQGEIVMYHTLLIWLGAGMSKIAGWGLYSLRSVSLIAGLILLGLLFVRRSPPLPKHVPVVAAVILVFCPLFQKHMIIYRPELLVIALGFASFVLLERGIASERWGLVIAAGACAGLSGQAHAAGLAFAAAGFVVLVIQMRWRDAVLFTVSAVVMFMPYVYGYFTDRALFMRQAFENKLLQVNLSMPWWQPLQNLAEEHKRWFRKPESIGICVLFLLSLTQVRRADWKRRRVFWQFLIVLALVLAILPLPKTTRYVLPLVPFFAVAIASAWLNHSADTVRWRKAGRVLLFVWTPVVIGSGLVELGYGALSNGRAQVTTNHELATKMTAGSLVMAPFDFVFEEEPRFVIQSFRGAELAFEGDQSVRKLERYADSLGVEYLIFSTTELATWGITPTELQSRIEGYRLVLALPERGRWLLARIPPGEA